MKKGAIYIFITTILFSSMEVAIKYSNGAFNSIQLNFLRFLVGAAILYPISRKKLSDANVKLSARDYKIFAISGILNIVFAMTLYTLSLVYMPAFIISILFCCNTFFSIILAELILKEKISMKLRIALVISFIGFMTIINPFNVEYSIFGFIIILLSAFLFALNGIYSKKKTGGTVKSGIVLTCYSFFFGSLELLILIILSRVSAIANILTSNGLEMFANIPIFSGFNSSNIFLFLYMAIGVTGIGFASYFLAIEKLGVTTTSLVFFIKPVLATIFAVSLLRERLARYEVVGLALVVFGTTIIFISRLKENKGAVENYGKKE